MSNSKALIARGIGKTVKSGDRDLVILRDIDLAVDSGEALAIVGAEYVLRWLPRGTHDYAKFIKPSELAQFCRNAGLDVGDITGMSYNPLSKIYSLGQDTDVNYIFACRRG